MDQITIPAGELDPIERIMFSLRSLYASYGYTHYRMGKFEEYDFYSRNKDFLVSDGVITFTDTNGKLMALKPDVTLSIVKNDGGSDRGVRKLYYDENVYRVSKRSNMFREIKQAGLECIGGIDAYHLGEVLSLAEKSLAAATEDFVLAVSDLDILGAFIDAATDDDGAKRALLKCVGEKNLHGIDAICAECGAPSEKAEALKALVSLYGEPKDVIERLSQIPGAPDVSDGVRRLADTLGVFKGGDERIQIDFSIVSDLRYYNGIVFKGFVAGIPDSVLSGGQYDKLMDRMRKKCRAVGFAVYLDLLERLGAPQSTRDADIMLVYGGEADDSALRRAIEELIAAGSSVAAVSEVDPALNCGKICRFENGEVISLENDA